MNVSGSTSHLDHNILFASQGVTVSISIYRQFNICIENSGFHNIDFYSLLFLSHYPKEDTYESFNEPTGFLCGGIGRSVLSGL